MLSVQKLANGLVRLHRAHLQNIMQSVPSVCALNHATGCFKSACNTAMQHCILRADPLQWAPCNARHWALYRVRCLFANSQYAISFCILGPKGNACPTHGYICLTRPRCAHRAATVEPSYDRELLDTKPQGHKVAEVWWRLCALASDSEL